MASASVRHGYYTRDHFTDMQQHFIHQAVIGKNIFLTGRPGSGKSFVLKKVRSILERKNRNVAVAAPTGIAATNAQGVTLHTLFALRPYGMLDYEACNFLRSEKRVILQMISTLIIDEISMVRADLLDAVEYTLLKNRADSLTKKQVIFVGDMQQLPPVVTDNMKSVMASKYDGYNFFYSEIMKKLNVMTIELTEVVRQKDPDFLEALDAIRMGGKHPYFAQFAHKETKGIILAPYKATVEQYNIQGLLAQPGKEYVFKAKIEGKAREEDFNLEPEICVKNGCKIMYLVNSPNGNLVNGTMGIFEHEDERGNPDGINYIRVGNIKYKIEKHKLSKWEYVRNPITDTLELKEIGSIEQYPFRLAYAITIHKCQGLTLDEVTVDCRQGFFQSGMMYVALSRVRTPQGLRLIVNDKPNY